MSTEKKFLTFTEAALYLDIFRPTLYKLTHEKKLPCYKPNGKKLYFKKKELEDWIEQGKMYSHED